MPDGACVTTDVEIGAGAADILDRDYDGVDVDVHGGRRPTGRPLLHIDADVGVGVLEVVARTAARSRALTASGSRSSTTARAGARSRHAGDA